MTESIMDSTEQVQVGVSLKHPRIGPLSLWERARVRGFSAQRQIALVNTSRLPNGSTIVMS
jgi:hypothetical protein